MAQRQQRQTDMLFVVVCFLFITTLYIYYIFRGAQTRMNTGFVGKNFHIYDVKRHIYDVKTAFFSTFMTRIFHIYDVKFSTFMTWKGHIYDVKTAFFSTFITSIFHIYDAYFPHLWRHIMKNNKNRHIYDVKIKKSTFITYVDWFFCELSTAYRAFSVASL